MELWQVCRHLALNIYYQVVDVNAGADNIAAASFVVADRGQHPSLQRGTCSV